MSASSKSLHGAAPTAATGSASEIAQVETIDPEVLAYCDRLEELYRDYQARAALFRKLHAAYDGTPLGRAWLLRRGIEAIASWRKWRSFAETEGQTQPSLSPQ